MQEEGDLPGGGGMGGMEKGPVAIRIIIKAIWGAWLLCQSAKKRIIETFVVLLA
jgi:hypothetical protein